MDTFIIKCTLVMLVIVTDIMAQSIKNGDSTKCPTGWTKKYKSCYYFSRIPLTWRKSSEFCQNLHPESNLAFITSQEELYYLQKKALDNAHIDCFNGGLVKQMWKRLSSRYFHNSRPERCVQFCRHKRFSYATVEVQRSTDCYCGNQLRSFRNDGDEPTCILKCIGDNSENCGTRLQPSIYETAGRRLWVGGQNDRYSGIQNGGCPILNPSAPNRNYLLTQHCLKLSHFVCKKPLIVTQENVPAVSSKDVHEEIICQHRWMSIWCENGVIDIISASFGRQNNYTCFSSQINTTNCHSQVSELETKKLCNGKQYCYLFHPTDIYGDPCVGTLKYLTVTYTCSGNGHSRSVVITDTQTLERGKENQQFVSTSQDKQKFKIGSTDSLSIRKSSGGRMPNKKGFVELHHSQRNFHGDTMTSRGQHQKLVTIRQNPEKENQEYIRNEERLVYSNGGRQDQRQAHTSSDRHNQFTDNSQKGINNRKSGHNYAERNEENAFLSDEGLFDIASTIVDIWREFIKGLGLQESVIDNIIDEFPYIPLLIATKSFIEWRDRSSMSERGMVILILQTLRKHNRRNLALYFRDKYRLRVKTSEIDSDIKRTEYGVKSNNNRGLLEPEMKVNSYDHQKDRETVALPSNTDYTELHEGQNIHETIENLDVSTPQPQNSHTHNSSTIGSNFNGGSTYLENGKIPLPRQKDVLSDASLAYIGSKLQDIWEKVMITLGLTKDDIRSIKLKNPYDAKIQALNGLRLWKAKYYENRDDMIQSLLITLDLFLRTDLVTHVKETYNIKDVNLKKVFPEGNYRQEIPLESQSTFFFDNLYQGQGCVQNCNMRKSGYYQSCNTCHGYATCVWGILYDKRPCPKQLVWNDIFKVCDYKSPTCKNEVVSTSSNA